jgi:Fe-S oxidoreductase
MNMRPRICLNRVPHAELLDIKTVIVSCGTCMDQLQKYQFEKIFPGCRLLDIHEYLMEKVKLEGSAARYMSTTPATRR